MALTDHLKKLVPTGLRPRLKDLRSKVRHINFVKYDYDRFARNSGSAKLRQALEHQDAEITKIYHAIEKGLALPAPRPGFGAEAIAKLLDLLDHRMQSGQPWTHACRNSINALVSYRSHATSHGVTVNARIDDILEAAAAEGHLPTGSANKVVTRADISAATDFDAKQFFWSRHSVRNFAPATLDKDRLAEAIDLARSTPSVCNRQSARVVVVPNEGQNFNLLRHQNGNRGFGTAASAFLVVLSDLRSFVEPEERYQAWIDGGMFSMALVLALHAKQFGACCLNWSNTAASDRTFRQAANIPDHETVIMLIAVGELPESIVVANSDRLPLTEIYRYL